MKDRKMGKALGKERKGDGGKGERRKEKCEKMRGVGNAAKKWEEMSG